MSKIRRLVLLAAMAISAAPFVVALADARKEVGLIEGWDNRGGTGVSMSAKVEDSASRNQDWAAYYDKYAQVRYGPQKKLANGVRWRLAIDQRTEVGIPRIVWMPRNVRRDSANRMLDMVQGAAMLFSDRTQEEFLVRLKRLVEEDPVWLPPEARADYRRGVKDTQKSSPKRIVKQTDVGLTYASSNFVSLIDLGYIYQESGNDWRIITRSVTLDLGQQQIMTMEACPNSIRNVAGFSPLFRFADLLEICDQSNLQRFVAMVKAVQEQTTTAATHEVEGMVRDCEDYSIDVDQEFVVSLAVDGLAVFLTGRWCPLTLSARNPIVVPYRDLEPLMKAGPMRDELLKARPAP